MATKKNPDSPGPEGKVWISKEKLNCLEAELDNTRNQVRLLQGKLERVCAGKPCFQYQGDERLQYFIEQAPVAIAMFDREMRYISASRRWRSDFKLGERNLYGLSHYEIFPEIPEHWKIAHKKGLAGEIVSGAEDRFERANGTVQWLRWEIQPWHDSHEEVGGIIIFTEDITERKTAESLLHKSEERYKSLADLSPDGILVNLNGRFVYANEAAGRFLGTSNPKEILGRSPFDFLEPEYHSGARERIARVLNQRGVNPLAEQVWRRLDGEAITLEVAASPITWEGKLAVLVLLRDVTDRKKAEEALRKSDQMKTEFITTTAHEFRTPLTSIQGYSELLLSRDDLPPEITKEFLSYIHESSVDLGRIVSDLLDISRIERGLGLSLDLSQCTVREIFTKVGPLLKGEMPAHQLKISLLEEDTTLEVDKGRIGQVLENILNNAFKYSPSGSLVEVSGEPTTEGYRISVADHGIGMTPEQQENIFEKFYRVDTSHASVQGIGLGMSIVKQILEAHGGKIWIESELGRGTSVTFVLPKKHSREVS